MERQQTDVITLSCKEIESLILAKLAREDIPMSHRNVDFNFVSFMDDSEVPILDHVEIKLTDEKVD